MDHFTKSITTSYGPDQFTIHKIEIDNCIILNVLINGICDTTFELPLTSPQAINLLSNIEDNDILEPRIIVGDFANLKIQIIAGQIGKLLLKTMKEPKSVILSIGSKWFGREVDDTDFEKLMFVLESVGEVIKEA